MIYFTIGEIFRLKLLKNHKGQPYTNKGTISNIVSSWPSVSRKTPWGIAKTINIKDINKHNAQWK